MLKSRRIGFNKDEQLGVACYKWYVKNLYRILWNHLLYVIPDINQDIAIDLRLIYDARAVTRSVRLAFLHIHSDAVSAVSICQIILDNVLFWFQIFIRGGDSASNQPCS